jgi:para-aminobenzoate synthetase
MGALGSDLWAPGSVQVLRSGVADKVVETVQEHLDAIDVYAKEQSSPDEDTSEEKKEDENSTTTDETEKPKLTVSTSNHIEAKEQRVKQLLFDLLYIQRFVSNAGEDDDRFASLAKKTNLADLDEAAVNRLRKTAADYAKKTYLLFALLA